LGETLRDTSETVRSYVEPGLDVAELLRDSTGCG
jgi:hypothetical protein